MSLLLFLRTPDLQDFAVQCRPDSLEPYLSYIQEKQLITQCDQGYDVAMNAPTLIFAFMSLGVPPVMSGDAQFERGSVAVARDPTGSVLGTDSTQCLDQLMEFARHQDQEAVKELMREGHLFSIESGSSVEILGFDSDEHAYKVRLIGSNKEVYLVKETVVNE